MSRTAVKITDNKGETIFEGTDEEFSSAAKKLAGKGHNRVGGVSADHLKSIVMRVEKLEEEKHGLVDDISQVFLEAKGNGFCVKTIKQIIKMRKKDAQVREEEQSVLEVYMNALGMLPLFDDAAD